MTFPPPKLDPKSGRWRFRKVVPPELREVIGSAEKVKWLGTDPTKARALNTELHLEWDNLFKSLRKGVTSLSRADAADPSRG